MQIGFSQRIRLEWLERTAGLVLADVERVEIELALQDLLAAQISVGGRAERGNREKAITILLKVWSDPPKSLRPMRNDGLEWLRRLPNEDHLLVHWGMTMAVYPFFGAVAETTGRLLRLQGTADARDVQRRLREQLGERETVARAARRTLRCFVDWGALVDTPSKGTYAAAPPRPVPDHTLIAWLIEATLHASDAESVPLRTILRSPALFPFALDAISPAAIRRHPRLDVSRLGLDEDIVGLHHTR